MRFQRHLEPHRVKGSCLFGGSFLCIIPEPVSSKHAHARWQRFSGRIGLWGCPSKYPLHGVGGGSGSVEAAARVRLGHVDGVHVAIACDPVRGSGAANERGSLILCFDYGAKARRELPTADNTSTRRVATDALTDSSPRWLLRPATWLPSNPVASIWAMNAWRAP